MFISFFFAIALGLSSQTSVTIACTAEVCCNESCSEKASCTGTLDCHADANNGVVTCDGARAQCIEQ